MAKVAKKRWMQCHVCGESAGNFLQWPNRDRGYGICRNCAFAEHVRDPNALQQTCGTGGIHYDNIVILRAASGSVG